MRGWLVGLAFAAACTGQPDSPAPNPFPEAPQTERRAAPEAGLPVSVATSVVPEGHLEVRFDAGGLRVVPPGGSPRTLVPAVDEGDGRLAPEGMSRFGKSLPAFEAWVLASGGGSKLGEVVIAVPATARYAVLKSLMVPLFEHGAVRVVHLVVQDEAGAERSIRIEYPKLYPPGETPPPTLTVSVDGNGLKLKGLGNTTALGYRNLRCKGGCSDRASYPLADAARVAYRAHAHLDAEHLLVVPHSDLSVDVIVGVLDHLRDDRAFNRRGEVMFPIQMLAGSRTYMPTTQDNQNAVRARANAATRVPADTDGAGAQTTDGDGAP